MCGGVGVFGSDCVAVNCGAVESGHVFACFDVLGEDAVVGFGEGDGGFSAFLDVEGVEPGLECFVCECEFLESLQFRQNGSHRCISDIP